jgi:hypothetical protein
VANIALKANVPAHADAVAGTLQAISGVSITDPQLFGNASVTVKLSDTTGLLGVTTAGAAKVTGAGTNAVTIKGTLADVNSTLSSLTYLCPGANAISTDTITVQAQDSAGAGDQEQIGIAVTPIPSFMTDRSTLDFKTADQSMWTSGKALAINDSINLLSALSPLTVGPDSIFDGDLSFSGSLSASLILALQAKTGGISLDYPVNGGVVVPNAVAPGQQFVVQTLDNGVLNATLSAVFPTFTATLTAGLDATLNATIDSDLLPGSPYYIDFDAHPSYQLFKLESGEKKSIGFDGVGSLDFLIPKDYEQTSTTTGTGGLPTVTTNAQTPNFVSASIELFKLLTELGVPIPPLSGSFFGGDVSYDIASATLHAGIDIAQQFQFQPTGISVTITTPWGASATVPIGSNATFTVPSDQTVGQNFTLTTSYTLTGNLVNNSGIAGNADLALSALSGNVEHLGSFGPLFQTDIPLYQGSPVFLIGPDGLIDLDPFPLEGFNTVSDTTSIPVLSKIYAVTPGKVTLDTTGFSATDTDTIQTAISRLGAKLSATNAYDPGADTGSATADSTKFNIETITSAGNSGAARAFTLPVGFQAGLVEAGSGSVTLSDANGGVLLAAADSGDILSGVGNDTLVGGQAGGVTFEIALGFSGEIDGLEPGDVIDAAPFGGSAVGDADLNGNTLTLSIILDDNLGPLPLYSFAVSGDDLADTKMVLTDDGHGGTNIKFYRYASALVNNGIGTIKLPNAHQFDQNDQVGVTVTNVSRSPAETLILGAAGSFSGNIPQPGLAAGQTSTSDLQTAPLVTNTPGLQKQQAFLQFLSDGSSTPGDSGQTPLPTQNFTITGAVYGLAVPQWSNTAQVIHVGDTGVVPITITNAAPATGAASGYYEDLLASVVGLQTMDNMTAAGTTGDIAPGDSDSSSIAVTVPTTSATGLSGRLALDFTSDGTNVDGLGTTALNEGRLQIVDVQVQVNNYAQPQWSLAGGFGTLTGGGNAYTLDLGKIAQSIPGGLQSVGGPQTELSLLNKLLSGPQDQLGGTFKITGSSKFINDQFDPLQAIDTGAFNSNFFISLNTTDPGTFTETIDFTPTSINASSTNTLTDQIITVTGAVMAPTVVAPASVTIALNQATRIDGVSIADLDANGPVVNVDLSDANGLLSVNPGAAPAAIRGMQSNHLSISGSLDDVNALLATLTDTATAAGPDFIDITGTTADPPLQLPFVTIPGGSIPIVAGKITVNPNTVFNFTYAYADGKASYGGTVIDDGTLGYAAIAASADPTLTQLDAAGNVAGTYRLSTAGTATTHSGTVTINAYTDAASGTTYQFDHSGNAGKDGGGGLGSESEQFYVNGSAYGFTPFQQVGAVPAPLPEQIEDFNADGTSDILWQRGHDGNLMIFGVVNRQVVTSPSLGSIGGEWNYLGLGDFNGDGTTDVLWQRPSDGSLMVHIVVNDVVRSSPTIGAVGREWQYIGAGEFNGDGTSDLLWQRSDGELMIHDVKNNVVTGSHDIGKIGHEWTLLGTGDFDHSGSDDILWQRSDGELMIHNINADKVTGTADVGHIGKEWHFLGIGDFNGDGTSDILWLRANGDLMVFGMQNDQVVRAPTIGQFDMKLSFLDLGDFTGDGTEDILAEGSDGKLTVYNIQNDKITGTSSLGSIGSEWNNLPFHQLPTFTAG